MMFSLYLGHVGEQSKIWLGGYDRGTARKILDRHKTDLDVSNMTDEEVDAEIKWLPLVSRYYWMAQFDRAEIGGERWPLSADSLIFDSGSSVNHIPTKEFNILLQAITREHTCRIEMIPYETYYCECTGASDATYPVLTLMNGNMAFNFKPQDYLVYEKVDATSQYMCMVSFQKETRENTNFWLLGDSFLRAFYTVYDGENRRIGLVGDTEIRQNSSAGGADQEDLWNNPLVFFLVGALAALCLLAIFLSVFFSYRLRKRSLNQQ